MTIPLFSTQNPNYRCVNLARLNPDSGRVVWKREIRPKRWAKDQSPTTVVDCCGDSREMAGTVLPYAHIIQVEPIHTTNDVIVIVVRPTSAPVGGLQPHDQCVLRVNACGCIVWEKYFAGGTADAAISVDSSNENAEHYGTFASWADGSTAFAYNDPPNYLKRLAPDGTMSALDGTGEFIELVPLTPRTGTSTHFISNRIPSQIEQQMLLTVSSGAVSSQGMLLLTSATHPIISDRIDRQLCADDNGKLTAACALIKTVTWAFVGGQWQSTLTRLNCVARLDGTPMGSTAYGPPTTFTGPDPAWTTTPITENWFAQCGDANGTACYVATNQVSGSNDCLTLTKFDASFGVVWQVALDYEPTRIVATDDHVYVFTPGESSVICFDHNGNEEWRQFTPASSGCVADDGGLFVSGNCIRLTN